VLLDGVKNVAARALRAALRKVAGSPRTLVVGLMREGAARDIGALLGVLGARDWCAAGRRVTRSRSRRRGRGASTRDGRASVDVIDDARRRDDRAIRPAVPTAKSSSPVLCTSSVRLARNSFAGF
jgi:hypothetical protein